MKPHLPGRERAGAAVPPGVEAAEVAAAAARRREAEAVGALEALPAGAEREHLPVEAGRLLHPPGPTECPSEIRMFRSAETTESENRAKCVFSDTSTATYLRHDSWQIYR